MTILGSTTTDVVEVTGSDRASYLEAVTSQHLTDLDDGEVRGAMHLDAHGAPLVVFDVLADEDRLLLLVPRVLTATVLELLGGRTFLSDARFTHLDSVEVRSLRGAEARETAAAHGLDVAPGRVVRRAGLHVVGREHGVDLVGEPGALGAVAARLLDAGVAVATPDEVRAADIVAGVPAWEHEIRPPHLPEELGLLPSHVHLAKGCYPGQEAVARMWMLGRPRRALAAVAVSGPVSPGWTVGSGRRGVEVTSVAGDAALAFVPADAVVGDGFAGDDGGRVEIRRLVGTGAGVPGHDPGVTRRRDRRASVPAGGDEAGR